MTGGALASTALRSGLNGRKRAFGQSGISKVREVEYGVREDRGRNRRLWKLRIPSSFSYFILKYHGSHYHLYDQTWSIYFLLLPHSILYSSIRC